MTSASPVPLMQYKISMAPMYKYLLALLLILTAKAPVVSAQTLFSWPEPPSEFSRYTTLDHCLVFVHRLLVHKYNTDEILQDTVMYTEGRLRDTMPDSIRDLAELCSQRFNSDAVSIDEWIHFMRLALIAGRDGGADSIFSKRMSVVHDSDILLRLSVLDSAISQYGSAKPMRYGTILQLAGTMDSITASLDDSLMSVIPVSFRMGSPLKRIDYALEANDTVRAHTFARKFLDIPFTADEQSQLWRLIGIMRMAAVKILSGSEPMDSLKVSTASYMSLYDAQRGAAYGSSASGLQETKGRTAPDIEAEFWFPSRPAANIPTRGNITLVVDLDQFRNHVPRTTLSAVGRRLKKRFPDLEIVGMTSTKGYFQNIAPPTPEEEAAWTSRMWLEWYKLPATIGVSKTDFFNIPEPDRRRINQPVGNAVNYSFGIGASFNTFLVDANGLIVLALRFSNANEKELTEYLEALFAQSTILEASGLGD